MNMSNLPAGCALAQYEKPCHPNWMPSISRLMAGLSTRIPFIGRLEQSCPTLIGITKERACELCGQCLTAKALMSEPLCSPIITDAIIGQPLPFMVRIEV